jgi:solute carrier family 35, member F1/2
VYRVGYDTGNGSNPLLGDILCLIAATGYAISNVGQEACVKNFSSIEFLGMLGLYGSIICGIQTYVRMANLLCTCCIARATH